MWKQADVLDELIQKATKALREHNDFNEIELSEGDKKVRLVRFTPIPVYTPPAWPQ